MRRGGGQIAAGVNALAINPDLKVDVGTGGVTGAAHLTDELAPLHLLPHGHPGAFHVAVQGLHALTVVEDNRIAVACPGPTAVGHRARLGRVDRAAVGRSQVQGRVFLAVPLGDLPHHGPGKGVARGEIRLGPVKLSAATGDDQLLTFLHSMGRA